MSVHIQRPVTERERKALRGTSRSKPIADEHVAAIVVDVFSIIVPIVGVAFYGLSFIGCVVTWGVISTVAQLMHITAVLKASGTLQFRFRQEGGTWRREL